jgi:hypothetical protein
VTVAPFGHGGASGIVARRSQDSATIREERHIADRLPAQQRTADAQRDVKRVLQKGRHVADNGKVKLQDDHLLGEKGMAWETAGQLMDGESVTFPIRGGVI